MPQVRASARRSKSFSTSNCEIGMCCGMAGLLERQVANFARSFHETPYQGDGVVSDPGVSHNDFRKTSSLVAEPVTCSGKTPLVFRSEEANAANGSRSPQTCPRLQREGGASAIRVCRRCTRKPHPVADG